MKIDGECHCGKIAYQAEVDADTLVICHCTDSRSWPARLIARSYLRPPNHSWCCAARRKFIQRLRSGGPRSHKAFAAIAGRPSTPARPPNPEFYGLRIGAIKQRAELHPVWQIWCRSALPWAMDLSAINRDDGQMSMLSAVSQIKLPPKET